METEDKCVVKPWTLDTPQQKTPGICRIGNKRCPNSWWEHMSLTLTVKETRSVVKLWTRVFPPPDRNVRFGRIWRAQKVLLQSTILWGGGDRRMGDQVKEEGSEDKDCSSLVLASELQVILFSPWFFNPSNDMMRPTPISFEELQNINIYLIPGNMNCYAEALGHTSLLKMSKIDVKPIVPDPTLLPHSLVSFTHYPVLSYAHWWWGLPDS